LQAIDLALTDSVNHSFLTQKERDVESGLDYFWARYYSSSQGRFTSVDPENAGADSSYPQTWNGYSYALNTPTIFIDPDGREVRICDTQGNCSNLSDQQAKDGLFNKQYQQSIGGVVKDGKIYQNGELIGTYARTSFDDWSDYANRVFFGDGRNAGLIERSALGEKIVKWMGAAAVAQIAVPTILLEASGGAITTLGITEGPLARLSLQQLNSLIRGNQQQLLRRLFGQGVEGAKQSLGNLSIPSGLSREALLVYREIARRAIERGVDKAGVQALRMKIINEALKKLK
jgi:RHS repeat-associated protein